jgi:hypothetical protein
MSRGWPIGTCAPDAAAFWDGRCEQGRNGAAELQWCSWLDSGSSLHLLDRAVRQPGFTARSHATTVYGARSIAGLAKYADIGVTLLAETIQEIRAS